MLYGASAICGIIVLIAQAKILYSIGEAGWKIIIPIYGEYLFFKRTCNAGTIVLQAFAYALFAELFVLCFPLMGYCFFLGPVICMLFLSILLANSYNKSYFFGLGLFILPVIFYVVLAFNNKTIDNLVTE